MTVFTLLPVPADQAARSIPTNAGVRALKPGNP